MEKIVNGCKLQLILGDITEQEVDVIVNAANKTLLGGGGVDGAIHRAAGPELLQECKQIRDEVLGGSFLETAKAVMTKGYNLRAKHVIHVVGPIYGVNENPKELLATAYRDCLELAKKSGLTTIAFPSISTGAYGCDISWASKVALSTVGDFVKQNEMQEARFVLFSNQDLDVYAKGLADL